MTKKSFIVFTDGSAINMREAATNPELISGSYAYVISEFSVDEYNYFTIEDKYRYGSGYMKGIMSPRAELLAIYNVLLRLKDYVTTYKVDTNNLDVLLVSDSLNSVLTYNQWIWKWTINKGERDMVRKGNKIVKNSDVIYDTYFLLQELVGDMRMRIELVHLNSHIPKIHLGTAYMEFMAKSSLNVSEDLFLEIVARNNLTDKLATEQNEIIFNDWENDKVE